MACYRNCIYVRDYCNTCLLVVYQVECLKRGNQKLPSNGKCELSLKGRESQESFHQISMLMDDEELEMRDSEAVRNPPGCSGLFSSSAHQGWL